MNKTPFAFHGSSAATDHPSDMIEDSIHGLRVIHAVTRGLEVGVDLDKEDALGLCLLIDGLIATLKSAREEVLKLQEQAAREAAPHKGRAKPVEPTFAELRSRDGET